MWVEKRHHAFIKCQASTKAYAKSSSNPIRGGKYLLDHLIHFPANARQFLRVNFLASAANSPCDCGSVILPLGCHCNFHAFLCISKQTLFCSVIACVAVCPAWGVISGFHSGEHHQTLHVAGKGVPMEWGMLGAKGSWGHAVPWAGASSSAATGIGEMKSQKEVSLLQLWMDANRLSPKSNSLLPNPAGATFDKLPLWSSGLAVTSTRQGGKIIIIQHWSYL